MLIAQEKYLKFTGYETDALNLVNDIRHVFDTAQMDMPKVINDFVFNIEVALQNAGILDEDFNEVDRSHGSPWDRGSADSYYGRPRDPHYYPEGTGNGERVNSESLDPEQLKAYMKGYDHNEEFGHKKSYE
jgi:hypothetical protein